MGCILMGRLVRDVGSDGSSVEFGVHSAQPPL